MFAILFFLYWKTEARKKSGYLFGLFLVLLFSVRIVVESVKESQGGFESALVLLSTGQWLSIPIIVTGKQSERSEEHTSELSHLKLARMPSTA